VHIDSALAEIATLKERLAETERARDQADAKCRELSEENEGLKREVEELTSQAATLTARIRVLEQENITLTERQQALETANASLEAQQMATAAPDVGEGGRLAEESRAEGSEAER
jgi:predicted nuclease with TOPRIM domain